MYLPKTAQGLRPRGPVGLPPRALSRLGFVARLRNRGRMGFARCIRPPPLVILLTDGHGPAPALELTHGTGPWTAIRPEPRCLNVRRPGAVPAWQLGNHIAVLLTALATTDVRHGHVRHVITDYLRSGCTTLWRFSASCRRSS